MMTPTPDVVPMGAAGRDGAGTSPFEFASTPLVEEPETDKEAEAGGILENARFWQKSIPAALVAENRWRQEAEHAERLYFGPDNDPGRTGSDEAASANPLSDETAFIHANIEVLKPLVFSETPTPIVTRRYRGDGKTDETDLMAAEAGQRMAQWILSTTDFDGAMEAARDDWLIAGRGYARALYKAEFGMVAAIDPNTGEVTQEERKLNEEVIPRHVEWRRLLFCPGHSYATAPWMAIETPMTRARVKKRFPDKLEKFSFTQAGLVGASRAKGDDERAQSQIGATVDRSNEVNNSPFDVATVWEIWVRESRQVIWWSPDASDVILDKQDDPLNLEGFFPGPKPILATTRSGSLNPRPDIAYYAERAAEIETATRKMRSLLKVLAVAGLFPGSMSDQVKKLMMGENQLIPMESWIQLMEKGGTANLIQWLPIEPIVACLNALAMMRAQSKGAMFEASGVSDIMRSQGDPNETATAQQIKGRYANLRLAVKQRHMAKFARDLLVIMMEIALEMFDTKRIADICGLALPMTEAEREQRLAEIQMAKEQFAQAMLRYQMLQQAMQAAQAQAEEAAKQGMAAPQLPPMPPPPEEPKFDRVPETSWELVHARLKQDFLRKITLSIETDSTVLADEQADKEARIEFLGAFSTFVQQLLPLTSSGVFDGKTIKELLLFGIRSFPKSRTLEGLISQLPDEPQGQPPEDTAVLVAKIRAEVDMRIKEMDMQSEKEQRVHEMRLKGAELLADSVENDAGRAASPQRPPGG